MPFIGKDFIILGIAVPLKHFVKVVFDLGLRFGETVGARGVGNSPELAFHRDVPVFIRQEAVISADDSKVTVCVIPTNEEIMIARDTLDLVTTGKVRDE